MFRDEPAFFSTRIISPLSKEGFFGAGRLRLMGEQGLVAG